MAGDAGETAPGAAPRPVGLAEAVSALEDGLILPEQWDQICGAIETGHSTLVLAEAGMLGQLPEDLCQRFSGGHVSGHASQGLQTALVTYKGSGKRFFVDLAQQLGIPTTEPKLNKDGEAVGEKDLAMDALKEEILANVGDAHLLILPEAKRLTTGIRYWLEDAIASGVTVCCFAVVNPGRDIFLDMAEIELEMPSERRIRQVMADEAQRQGLQLSRSRLSQLQPLAGRNPMLARRVVRDEALGLTPKAAPRHTQYLDISPLILAATATLAILRFIGMGTGNKSLYIIGGCAMMVGLSLRYLSKISGPKRKLGQ